MGTLVLTRGENLGGVLGAGSPDGEAAILELRSDLLLHRFAAAACSLHGRGKSMSGGGEQVACGSGEGKGGEGSGGAERGGVAGNGGTKWRETAGAGQAAEWLGSGRGGLLPPAPCWAGWAWAVSNL